MRALVHTIGGESTEYADIDFVIKDGTVAIFDVAGLHVYPLSGVNLHLQPETAEDAQTLASYMEALNSME